MTTPTPIQPSKDEKTKEKEEQTPIINDVYFIFIFIPSPNIFSNNPKKI